MGVGLPPRLRCDSGRRRARARLPGTGSLDLRRAECLGAELRPGLMGALAVCGTGVVGDRSSALHAVTALRWGFGPMFWEHRRGTSVAATIEVGWTELWTGPRLIRSVMPMQLYTTLRFLSASSNRYLDVPCRGLRG